MAHEQMTNGRGFDRHFWLVTRIKRQVISALGIRPSFVIRALAFVIAFLRLAILRPIA